MQSSNIDPNWPQSQTLQVLDERLSQMAFLPHNKLASIGYLGELRIWDQRSCSRLHSLSHGFKRGFITILAWYNSRIIAVGWPDMIKVWNLDSGACVRSFPLTRCSGTETIAFSDDRKFICSICTLDLECVAFIHSLDTGKCVSEFEIPDKPSPILLSPKGQWIAAIAQKSMLLSEWSHSTKPSWTVLGPQQKHDIVSFSSDGTLVASLSSTSKMVKVWSTESYECLHMLNFETPIVHNQLTLNQDWLVISLDNYRTLVLDMKTGAVSMTLCSYFKAGPVISDDGTLLAGQSLEGAVRVWDPTSRTLTDSTATEQPMGVELVTPFKDDNTILSHSWGKVKIWDMESAICKEELEPEVPLETQTFIAAASGAPVFAILKDTAVEIWDTNPLRHVNTFERTFSCLGERYYCLAISANGERLAVGSSEPGTVEIWDVKNARVYMNTHVQVWDASTGKSIFLLRPSPELPLSNLATSFLNTHAVVQGGRAGDDVLGTYYISQDPAWVMRKDERILWLPPDYRPGSVYVRNGNGPGNSFWACIIPVPEGIGSQRNESILKITPSNVGY